MARNARPAGCGRLVPRSNHAGIPARLNACSSRLAYRCGDRTNTAISSKGTPARASSRMRRAISTHSRPSPGAENSRTSPVGVRSGGRRLANRYRLSATRSVSPFCSSTSGLIRSIEDDRASEDRRTAPSERVRRMPDQRANEVELGCGIEATRRAARAADSPANWHVAGRTTTVVAAAKSVARSVADAESNSRSNRSSSTDRSAPPSGSAARSGEDTWASRSSRNVRARARGKPGVPATGPK